MQPSSSFMWIPMQSAWVLWFLTYGGPKDHVQMLLISFQGANKAKPRSILISGPCFEMGVLEKNV